MADPGASPKTASGQKAVELDEQERLSMLTALPLGGIKKAFPNVPSCRKRFIETRWPNGVQCVHCGGDNIRKIANKSLFQCRSCRKQFTPTSGTPLHGSRQSIKHWFLATEAIIRYEYTYFRGVGTGITLQALCKLLDIHTEAASRMKSIIICDLGKIGDGLLRRAVCTKEQVSTDATTSKRDV